MKKLLLFFSIFFITSIQAQQYGHYSYVKDISPIEWNQKTTITTTNSVKGNKLSGTIAGAAVGHWLFKRSLLGTLIGGAVGNAASTSSSSSIMQHDVYNLVRGYQITLANGYIFKTFTNYPKWMVVNITQLQIQQ